MKIHRLELEFVGPFVGRQVIDFDPFVDSKVFLIEGPTGSGKSTLLDALVFGLYGGTATDRASTDRMRSDFAGSTDESRVRVVFETRSGIYRITRTPKYERLAKKGAERLTLKNPTVLLERLDAVDDPHGEPISSRAREADEEVVRVVGLDRNQFRQTVILPQGEFAKFLTAKSVERKEILQSIFKTKVFARTANDLRIQANEAESRRRVLFVELQNRLAAFAGVAQVEDLDLETSGTDLEEAVADYLDATEVTVHQRATRAREKHKAAETKWSAASHAFTELTNAKANFTSLTELTLEQQRLVEKDAEISDRNQLCMQITAALTLKPQLADLAEAKLSVDLSQQQLAVARAKLRAQLKRAGAPDAAVLTDAATGLDQTDSKTIAESLRTITSRLATLEPAIEVEVALVAATTDSDVYTEQQAALTANLGDLEGQIESNRLEQEEVAATLANQAPAASMVKSAEELVDHLRQKAKSARVAASLTSKLEELENQRTTALANSNAAADHQHRLHLQRIHGIAGELAQELKAGNPCAVCGSVVHPSPADLSAGHPSEADLDSAFAKAKQLQDQLQLLNQEHATFTKDLSAASAASDGLTEVKIAAKLSAAEDELHQARLAAKHADELMTHKQELEHQAANFQRTHTDMLVEYKGVETELAGAGRKVTELSEALSSHRGTYESVTERLTVLQESLEAVEQAQLALTSHQTNASRAANSKDILDQALKSDSIVDENQLQQLLTQESMLASLQQQVDDHKARKNLVTDQLKQSHIASALEVPTTALEAASTTAAVRQRKLQHKADKLALAQSTLERTQDEADRVREQLKAYNVQVGAFGPLLRLASVVNATDGLNQRGIPLETYVLLHQFEHVVDAANVRLHKISQGRFSLRASAAKSGRDKKGGLNLEIVDHNSESIRSPGDISGGETFYVSLSLALGLADVVTSQSGGIELGTLLIDEGFGTLDPEILDQVLRVVEKLSDSNRAVGIISHVEELKERISDQIQVVRQDDHTSTLRIVN